MFELQLRLSTLYGINPVAWSDIVIHLGDFHAMMAYFGVMGLYVSGSGFEEVLFQADLCSSGSIRGVISGKHYNRCWKIHETFAEVLERLFLEKFMADIPDDIKELAASHLSAVSRVIREVRIDAYGRPVTANGKLQIEFEGKFYKFSKVSISF